MVSIFCITLASSVFVLAENLLAVDTTTNTLFSSKTGKLKGDQNFKGTHSFKTSIVNGIPSPYLTRVSPQYFSQKVLMTEQKK